MPQYLRCVPSVLQSFCVNYIASTILLSISHHKDLPKQSADCIQWLLYSRPELRVHSLHPQCTSYSYVGLALYTIMAWGKVILGVCTCLHTQIAGCRCGSPQGSSRGRGECTSADSGQALCGGAVGDAAPQPIHSLLPCPAASDPGHCTPTLCAMFTHIAKRVDKRLLTHLIVCHETDV